jgi:hypothetical protein
MNLSAFTSNQQFKTVALLTGFFSGVYVFINLFVVGGDAFVIGLNNNLAVPLAICTVYFSFRLWQKAGTTSKSRFLWGWMIAGWVLWALAEILWLIFSISGEEIPYPSWADFFWLAGYIPMGIGLLARVHSLPLKLTTRQQMAVWGLSLGTVLFSLFFVILPTAQNETSQQWLESTLNIVYPVADLFLLLVVLYLFFAYEQGAYGLGWRLLLTGFILHQVSNVLFSYASTVDLYMPNAQATLLSTLGIDVPYNLSYVFWILGIYLLRLLLAEHQPFHLETQLKSVPNTHILIFTKKDGTIIEVSHNFLRWLGVEDVRGKTLGEVFGLDRQEETVINESMRVLKKLVDRPVQIKHPSGGYLEGWLCGMAILTDHGEYSGANFLLRGFSADESLDEKLSDSERSVLRYLLNQKISIENSQICQLLLDYYLAQIKLLYNMAFLEGGAILAQSLLDELQAAALRGGWPMQFKPQTIVAGTDYPVEVLQDALPVLLETSKQFVSEITETRLVEARLQGLNSQISDAVHQNLAQYAKNALAA